MAMVCPQCGTTFEQRFECDECGARLVYHEPQGAQAARWKRTRWMHTPAGRVVIGVLLAQGLFYALRDLFTGVMILVEGENASHQGWMSFHGLLFLQAVQVLAPALGGALAGSAGRGGFLLGALVGAANGALSLLLASSPAQSSTTVALLGLPLLQTLFGALGGWVGSTVWKPPQTASFLRAEKKASVPKPSVPLFAGPVAWVRVVLGTVLAVTGTLFAGKLFEAVLTASDGRLEMAYVLQDRIVTWEIKAFVILFGAGFAGAGTFNGLKQGLWVGIFVSIVLGTMPANHETMLVLWLTLISSLFLSIAGGWFGCQLLPPVVKASQARRKLGSAY